MSKVISIKKLSRRSTRVLVAVAGLTFGLLPAIAAHADALADLKPAVTYYQGAESLKPTLPGESIHVAPQLQPGKIGTAFLVERRTVNKISDPDFSDASTPNQTAWLLIGTPRFSAQGGFADPASASVTTDNYVRQVVSDLAEGKLYCLSVYAKSAEGGVLQMAVKSGQTKKEFTSPALGGEYARYDVSFIAGAPTATITLKAASDKATQIDAVQLEEGKSWPSSFLAKTGAQRSAEWVDVPARPEIYNPMKGAVAFWVKPQWLGQTSSQGQAFFAAYKDPTIPYSKNTSFMTIGAYTDPSQKSWHNGISITFRDKAGKTDGYTPLVFDGTLAPDAWHHIIVTWNIVPDGQSDANFYLDGKKVGDRQFSSGEIEAPANIYAGYYGGGYLDGLLDELYIFNRPVTDAEAAALFALNVPLK